MKNSNDIWMNHPNLYEINTLPWLNELSEKYNTKITLGNIHPETYQGFLRYFDIVWMMGVWERSPASKRICHTDSDLQIEFKKALNYLKDEDIVGSPYAVHYYHVDSNIGGKEELLEFREQLKSDSKKLILDFVPNHVARDHIWTLEKSDLFIEGEWEDFNNNPDAYYSIHGKILAHGKDPYFPPWTDTVQLNVFSKETRKKLLNVLYQIAEICDGVRCDMAMLVTNDIFKKTWGEKVDEKPDKDFWEEIIPAVKSKFPEFKFIAEVYWDMEWQLIQQGFDFCYDKRLYDKIVDGNVDEIRSYLHADFNYQKQLIRFIENHDEKRAMEIFNINKSKAAAVLTLTLPGIGLIHEGQMKGYEIKLPIQLKRRINENIKIKMLEFYRYLLSIISNYRIKLKSWELCDIYPINQEDDTNSYIIAYHWWNEKKHILIAINFQDKIAKGKVKIPSYNFEEGDYRFEDLLTGKIYKYEASNLQVNGLYIELNGWKSHIFEITRI